jgi:hypothetical protein
MSWTREELCERAFELAFFLQGDAAVAAEVTARALAKLAVAASAQGRRRAYLPRGRRTRLSVGEAHLLQRLIYVESEPFERVGERGELEEARWVVRFLKHLVRLTLKRNSFYAVLAVSRLLHGYSTAEALDLYALLVQDPGRVPDDDYGRSRKKRLMEELRERFGERLEVVGERGGEQRFRAVDDPAPLRPLVEECLRRFTPWGTGCPVPEVFDPRSTELPELAFTGSDADREHAVELRRFHAVLHPDCFARLAAALRWPPPAEKLEIPRFRSPAPGEPMNGPPRLEEEERRVIAARLAEEDERRRRSRSRFLAVRIDGEERARFARGTAVRLTLPSLLEGDAELVEIRGAEDGALFAVWLAGEPPAGISLGGGERLEIGREGVSYQPRWLDRISISFGLPVWAPSAALALLILGLGWLWRERAVPVAAPAPVSGEETRDLPVSPPAARLSEVKSIFVDASAGAGLAPALRAEGFLVPADRESADAVLQGRDEVFELVNADGAVLWRTDSGKKGAREIAAALRRAVRYGPQSP